MAQRTRKRKPTAKKSPKGVWMKTLAGKPVFKVLDHKNRAFNGGSFDYGPNPTGQVFEVDIRPVVCMQGLHLTNNPFAWEAEDVALVKHKKTFPRVYEAEYWLPEKPDSDDYGNSQFSIGGQEKGLSEWVSRDDDKIACRKIRLGREVFVSISPMKLRVEITGSVEGVKVLRTRRAALAAWAKKKKTRRHDIWPNMKDIPVVAKVKGFYPHDDFIESVRREIISWMS